MALFDRFPYLSDEKIIIRMMEEKDLKSLKEITDNTNVYKYCPYFLYKKSDRHLLASIRNLKGKDFEKRKHIDAGIYLKKNPKKLIGLAEMYDYKRKENSITIGYMINESYWHQGIATHAVALMKEFLINENNLNCLHAFVMIRNKYSKKVLLSNGFKRLPGYIEKKDWAGKDIVKTIHFVLINEE